MFNKYIYIYISHLLLLICKYFYFMQHKGIQFIFVCFVLCEILTTCNHGVAQKYKSLLKVTKVSVHPYSKRS